MRCAAQKSRLNRVHASLLFVLFVSFPIQPNPTETTPGAVPSRARLEKESKAATSKAKNNLVSVGGFDYIVVAQRIGVFEEFKARLVRDHPEALLSSLLALLCVCVVLAVRLSRARGHHRGSKRSGAKHEKQQ